MAASQHWLVICKSGEGSELKPNSYGEADFARIAWWESQRRDWLAVCVALCAPFCSFSLWQGCAPTEQSRETMGRPTLVPFWPPFCKHGSVEGQRRTVPTEKPTQFSRAPGGGTWPYFPGRQYKPPHPGARAGPGTTHWHPVTTQSPTPGCMHGLAYYCVPWPAIPGSLPFCFSKATTRHQLHHLTLHQESHLLSQKIIAAALPFCQTPLLPDKPCLRPKADHQKLPICFGH